MFDAVQPLSVRRPGQKRQISSRGRGTMKSPRGPEGPPNSKQKVVLLIKLGRGGEGYTHRREFLPLLEAMPG